MSAPRRHDVLAVVRHAMSDAGFQPAGGNDIYCCRLTDDVAGWVGLSTEVEDGVVEIAAKVGVRHDRIHRVVDEFRGRASDGAPTVSKMLGYLMPQKSANVVWRFDRADQMDAQARDLVAAVLDHGRPYMEAHADVPSLIDALQEAAPWEYSQVRIPAALSLLGRDADAQAFISEELRKLGDREDPAAEGFREFAARFGDRPVR